MEPDKWIALGAAIAASISAIAALLAVKQSNLQRKLSYKPQILLTPQYFDYEFDNTNLDILNRIKLRGSNNTNISKSNIAVNIGLGAALDIHISWTYDSTEIINDLNYYFQKTNTPIKLKKVSFGISLDSTDETPRGCLVREMFNEKIDYILSHSQNPTPANILIPFPFISLICSNWIFSHKAEAFNQKYSKSLEIKIEYRDIGGECYQEEYITNIDLVMISPGGDKARATGSLSFEKKHSQNRRMAGLERLRKGYVDIMKEENINYYSEL